ncbi:V-set and immunoglobulin domain-containing protein 1 isoform X3 [Phaenicophaeus curvirostris]|uniref:V-set and immunoglobulin domain-containing protein 1 isoform X3 n=1 Tax=Phaenicophaeus curvirostris TaxID=33595 RepID=UPI0037F09C5C
MLRIFPVLAILTGHVSGVVVTVPEKPVNVTTGGNATLLCTYTSSEPLGNFFIQWSFYSAKESQLHTSSPCHGILSMDEKSVSHCQKMVYVTDARGRCSWRYKIYYYSGGQSYSYGEFKNRITAATNPGNASITISNMQPSDTGSYTCEVFSPQGDAGQSQKSLIVNVLDPTTGILYIGNLTTFETGYYRCIASNVLGNTSCELDLTAKHSDGGIVAGALIGAVLAAAVICVIVWVLTKKAKNKKTSSNEMQEMAQKQPNAEYVQVPNEENIPVTTVPSSNATNEYAGVDETAAPGTPGNDEKQEAEKEEIA